jgi:hypothetical protein
MLEVVVVGRRRRRLCLELVVGGVWLHEVSRFSSECPNM